ncbi:hypothetical protein JI749_00805 [Devosia oryziradicis]|uniref:Right-handed parallel beta-helix repeat-containing protein n=1 Tax=Devosia oryziradicis TaxID=2801335 RepID=A0ABX7BW88_9HYPH|nr:hypothetical protein [Devosia oryziradicis]QQR36217.1 hypothetical protein JI749_00805 [Devosia oryziradicis]
MIKSLGIIAAGIVLLVGAAWAAWVGLHALQAIQNLRSDIRTVRLEAGTLASALEKTIVDSQERRCDYYITALPATISAPGMHCLTSDLTAAQIDQDAISIQADGVTLDGFGHQITGKVAPDARYRGIIGIDRNRVTVQHLNIVGFRQGIVFGSSAPGSSSRIVVRDVSVDRAAFQGVRVAAESFSVIDALITNTGPSDLVPNTFTTAIDTRGNNCIISGNRVAGTMASGTGEAIGISLYRGAGCIVEDNIITAAAASGEFSRNFGIWTNAETGPGPKVENNTVIGAHYAFGPHGMFSQNTAANPVCGLFAKRELDLSTRDDLGGNTSIGSGGADLVHPRACLTVATAIDRYRAQPQANAAYAVALQYSEESPEKMVETLAWLLVAAHLGHPDAEAVAQNPEAVGYTMQQAQSARELAESLAAGH